MKRILAILLCFTLAGGMAMTAHADESTLDFFKGLNFDDGLSVVVDVFHRFPLQYATTLGLDGNPQIRPIEFRQRSCWFILPPVPIADSLVPMPA